MPGNLITILIIVGICGITASRNTKTLLDLERILNSIISDDTSNSKELEDHHKVNHNQLSHHRHGNRNKHQKKDTPNMMNVQTMNLFVKPKKQGYNIDDILRTETDRTCLESGRCGCTGTRCGDLGEREDEVANEIDTIVDKLNKQIDTDDTDTDDTDNEEFGKLRCDGDKCEYYAGYYGIPEHRPINDIDILILDNPHLNSMEENEFIDLTRNKLQPDDEANKRNAIVIELNKNSKPTDLEAYESPPTPDEFVRHYETVKNDVIVQLMYYLQTNTPIPLRYLHDKQIKLLNKLKMKYNQGLAKKTDLKSEIVRIIFGEKSGTKIYPHVENNDNIYIPKWHYNSLLQFKRDLRSKKRLLPLTTQQKGRLLNKQTKTIPKLAWRKSLNQNVQKFGVPFNLEVHGLGQINS